MLQSKNISINMGILLIVFAAFSSCSKKDTTPSPVDVCAGKTIVITATPTASSPCVGTDGSINVSAAGSTGFSFKLNSGGAY